LKPSDAGIQRAELRRKEAKLSLKRRTMDPGHLEQVSSGDY